MSNKKTKTVKSGSKITKTARARKTKGPSERKLSALDAAAKVLGETGEPMNAKALIEMMAAKGYWTSPGGATPHATLFAAMMREINVKRPESRFAKVDRGQFALNGGMTATKSANKTRKTKAEANAAAETTTG